MALTTFTSKNDETCA
jgi:hypothetical protein